MTVISIIMPVYNGERYLSLAINSVINQSFDNWELFVIDDGSVDNSKDVILSYSDKRINFIQKKNGGQASARNLGLQYSKGKFIAFLDCDDFWEENFLKSQVEILNKGFDLVFSNGFVLNGFQMSRSKLNPGEGIYWGYTGFVKFINGNFFIPTSSVLVSRKLLFAVGLFDENLNIKNAEDFDLWGRLFLQGCKAFGNSETLINYRIHSNQSSLDDYSNQKSVLNSLFKFTLCYELYRDLYLAILSRVFTLKTYKDKLFLQLYLSNLVRLSPYWLDKLAFRLLEINLFILYLKLKFMLMKRFRLYKW